MIDTYDDSSSEYERPNKSQLKRESQALLDLTKALIALPEGKWSILELPEQLLHELGLLKAMPQHIAKKRQLKRVAKLLRDVDVSVAMEVVAASSQERVEGNIAFHRMEQWRDRLLTEGRSALTEFLQLYPHADVQLLSQLMRNAKQELSKGKSPKSSKLLFKQLRSLIG